MDPVEVCKTLHSSNHLRHLLAMIAGDAAVVLICPVKPTQHVAQREPCRTVLS
jgi:hypothetical protein